MELKRIGRVENVFIELVNSSHKTKELINIKSIERVKKLDEGTLVISDSSGTKYKESYEKVKDLIKREVAAERGY